MQSKTAFSVIFTTLLLFSFTSFISCKKTRLNYYGLNVPQEKLVSLKSGGPHEYSWQTEDITVQYQFTHNENSFKLSGWVDFSNNIKNYRQLEYFYLWVHFIDSENKIIATTDLLPLAYFYEVNKMSFEKTIELPPGVKAFVFSYSGYATEISGGGGPGDSDGGTDWKFWKTPHG